MVPLNMLFAIMVGSYHNRKFAIMVFAIMVGSYHNRKFAIMVFAIMVWNPFLYSGRWKKKKKKKKRAASAGLFSCSRPFGPRASLFFNCAAGRLPAP